MLRKVGIVERIKGRSYRSMLDVGSQPLRALDVVCQTGLIEIIGWGILLLGPSHAVYASDLGVYGQSDPAALLNHTVDVESWYATSGDEAARWNCGLRVTQP